MNISEILYDDKFQGTRILYRKNYPSIQPGIENSHRQVIWFPPRSELSEFRDGLAIVEEHIQRDGYYESRSGVIDLYGNWTIEQKYHQISYCGLNRFYATTNNQYESYLLDAHGNRIRRFDEEFINGTYNDGFLLICRVAPDLTSAHYSYINMDGVEVIPGFTEVGLDLDFENNIYCNGLVRFNNLGKWGYLNRINHTVILCIYDYGSRFNDNLAAVKLKGKYGFIDKSGRIQIQYMYDEAYPFYDGLARVKRNKKWGLIDRAGNIIVSFEYDEMNQFYNDIGCVKKNMKWGMVNIAGKIILPFEYDELGNSKFYNDQMIFKNNGKLGIVDRDLVVRIQPQYDVLRFIHQSLFYYEVNNICGIRDSNGNTIISEEIWGTEKFALG